MEYSQTFTSCENGIDGTVLILILMEYSQTHRENLSKIEDSYDVLILILMEYSQTHRFR